MADITMNVDDTLELDTVIREDISAKDPLEVTDGTDYNINGIQTKTAIFDPQSSGDYTIKVNGQELSIKVTDTIPSSVAYQWSAKNFAKPWSADKGSLDMSLTGDLQTSKMSNDRKAVQADGSDDGGTASISNMGKSLNESAWEFTIQSTNFSSGWWGVGSSDSLPLCHFRFDYNEKINSDSGNILVFVRDLNGNDIRVSPSTNPNLDDGNIHKISILFNNTVNNNVNIIIDGSSIPLTFSYQESPSFNNNFNDDFGFWVRNSATKGLTNYLSSKTSIIRIHDQSIDKQTI